MKRRQINERNQGYVIEKVLNYWERRGNGKKSRVEINTFYDYFYLREAANNEEKKSKLNQNLLQKSVILQTPRRSGT